ELVDKIDTLATDIQWHMVGHLQRNKVKYIVGKVAMIHSVDSSRLAEEISKESLKKGVVTEILLEVNVAQEENKFGFSVDEVAFAAEQMSGLKGISVKGLMTSAPFVENAEENRPVFRKLKQLYVDINGKNIDNICMDTLSMGMTNDYIVAVEEGATLVRVGTAIFGARNYNK
ncbi:MAG: YggS family pyridoxal phosphate-dependent enzyme, partial [Lachnospira sp.]|nr:YggS family pyridoxal phosphate-dependent enzyme [Lachnospira sp.]